MYNNYKGDTVLCLNCLRSVPQDTDVCDCGSKNLVKKKGKKYLFLGQVYSEIKWLAFLAADKRFKINPLYLEEKFRKNMRIHTFTRLLLPALFFIALSLGTGIFLFAMPEEADLHQNSIAVAGFVAALYLFSVWSMSKGFIWTKSGSLRNLGTGESPINRLEKNSYK